jgi:hypothetical protein
MKPEELIDIQLRFYNALDTEGFLSTYAEEIELFTWGKPTPDTVGLEQMRLRYSLAFQDKERKAVILRRIVIGNKVIDEEFIQTSGGKSFKAIALYEIENDKIRRVTFIRE